MQALDFPADLIAKLNAYLESNCTLAEKASNALKEGIAKE
jgi:hypothetical protein